MRTRAHPIDFRDLLKRMGPGVFDRYAPIAFGDWTMSVQAGQGVYSTPRERRDDPREYSAFEVALFHGESGAESPPEGAPCPEGQWEFDSVGAYLEVEEVQALFDWFRMHDGEPHAG